ncbi:hypothetical protein QE152_g6191 [Popillia japonica]|uniref:Peptidase A2 domain-containing protein n=1 Tax=Popillia japonica TaxID=7064 RepID=A0AAW1ML13_POPJA
MSKNHFAVCCRFRQGVTTRNVQDVTEETSTADRDLDNMFEELLNVSSIQEGQSKSVWYEKLTLERLYKIKFKLDYKIKFKLDTGSQVNIIPLYLFNKMKVNITKKFANTTLRSYAGQCIKPLFSVVLLVNHRNRNLEVEFLVIGEQEEPILGLDTCLKLELLSKVDHIGNNNLKICQNM